MKTNLAVAIAGKTLQEFRHKAKRVMESQPDIIELRLDALNSLSVKDTRELIFDINAITKEKCSIIVTCRDKKEGGLNDHPDELRLKCILEAINNKVAYIDFEFENYLKTENKEKLNIAVLNSPNTRLILSVHDFEKPFEDIKALYRRMQSLAPAAIPKIVYKANHIVDTFDCFDLLHSTSGDRIVLCMGKAGQITRILAPKFNAFLTFASSDEKSQTAPGQISIREMKEIYHFDTINENTEIYGIIASPVDHSKSPLIHNTCFEKNKLNKLYVPMLVQGGYDELSYFLDKIRNRGWLDFRGCSVSLPHKINILNYVKRKGGHIDDLAKNIGACNTMIVTPDNNLSAYNTDCYGALDAVINNSGITYESLKDVDAAVIGAGGVSRAIVAGLRKYNTRVTIYNRTFEKARKLAAEFDCRAEPLDKITSLDEELVINCTSLGMSPNVDTSPLSKSLLRKDMIVFDTVYNPEETLLLKNAKSVGATCIKGADMFINQAIKQFELFTDQTADKESVKKMIYDCLNHNKQL